MVRASGLRGLYLLHDVGPAVAGHPHALIVDATVEIAALPVLLQEGIEGGEQIRHGARA